MKRLDHTFRHEWHVAINRHHDQSKGKDRPWFSWMYEAKDMADEVPRIIKLFEMERTDQLTKTHKQCSMQPEVPVINNHLKCCLGVKCKECPELIALESMQRASPNDIDTAKAWTCVAHIVSKGGDITNEGYILTVDDRMYWDNVNKSLSQHEDSTTD